MRDLTKVIDAMLTEIPETESELRTQLEAAKSTFAYSAPEVMGACWRRVADVLQEQIGDPRDDWHMRVADVFSGRTPCSED